MDLYLQFHTEPSQQIGDTDNQKSKQHRLGQSQNAVGNQSLDGNVEQVRNHVAGKRGRSGSLNDIQPMYFPA